MCENYPFNPIDSQLAYYHEQVLEQFASYVAQGKAPQSRFCHYGIFTFSDDLIAALDNFFLPLNPSSVHCYGSCINNNGYPDYIYSVFTIVDSVKHVISFVSSKENPTYIDSLIASYDLQLKRHR